MTEDEEGGLEVTHASRRFEINANSLFNVLTYLTSVKVAHFVRDFLREQKPQNADGLNLRWERYSIV
jgi:hypothetical protein